MIKLPLIALFVFTLSAQTIQITTAQNPNTVVQANPAGTTFQLAAGIFRNAQITPKDNDVFLGAPGFGTVLNGSRVLSGFTGSAGKWSIVPAAGMLNNTATNGGCEPNKPACNLINDLFLDNALLQRLVSCATAPTAGQWCFDQPSGQVRMFDNPSGHTVELGVTSSAFAGTALNVTIRGLIVEKYATIAQWGAIGEFVGSNWNIDNNEVRFNHGGGVQFNGTSAKVTGNYIHHNGQKGMGGGGTNGVVSGNEISYNNTSGYDAGWEAGGAKFWMTTNLQVLNNKAVGNDGPGLWTDTDNIGTVYSGNLVTDNAAGGIQHEVSQNCTIKNNFVYRNGPAPNWFWQSQISIQNSHDCEVANNVVRATAGIGNGIGQIQQNRGSGSRGPWLAFNNTVHDNDITFEAGSTAMNGLGTDTTPPAQLAAGGFANNHYHVPDITRALWQSQATFYNWAAWHAFGQDLAGTLDTNIVPVVIPAWTRTPGAAPAPPLPVPPPQVSAAQIQAMQTAAQAAQAAITQLLQAVSAIPVPTQ